MRVDELKANLQDARGALPAADPTMGRAATQQRVRRNQVRQAVTITGTVVLVVAVLAGIGRFGRNDALPVITEPLPTSSPHLATGFVPDGFTPSVILTTPVPDQPAGVDAPRSTRTIIFAKADASDDVDLAGDTFAVTVHEADPVRMRRPYDTTPDGAATIFHRDSGDGLRTTHTTDAAGTLVAVTSRTLSDRDQEDVVRAVLATPSGEGIERITPPAGYRAVSTSRYFGQIPYGNIVVSLAADGSFIGFDDARPRALPNRPRLLGISQVRADDLDVLRWFLGDERPVDVRGKQGIIGTFHSGESHSVTAATGGPGTSIVTTTFRGTLLAWIEADGTVVVIQGMGVSDDDLVRLAAELHPVSDDEWQAMTRTYSIERSRADCTPTADGGQVCGSTGTGSTPPAQPVSTTTP